MPVKHEKGAQSQGFNEEENSDYGSSEYDDEDNENDLNPDDGTFLTGVDGEQVAAKKKRKKPKQKN